MSPLSIYLTSVELKQNLNWFIRDFEGSAVCLLAESHTEYRTEQLVSSNMSVLTQTNEIFSTRNKDKFSSSAQNIAKLT